MKTLRLTLTTAKRAKTRIALLALLVALGMSVMAVVSELSRQSTEGLDIAIEQDTGGATGTYRFSFSSTLGLSPSALSDAVRAAASPLLARPPVVVETIPAQRPECPPFDQFGEVPMLSVFDADLKPAPVPFGKDLPVETQFCVAGASLAADTVYVPSTAEQRAWGSGLVVRPDVADVAVLNTTGAVEWSFVLVTGRAEDMSAVLNARITDALSDDARRQGLRLTDVMSDLRVDTASTVRAASDGIAMVYRIIGWGVLLLAGIGLLVSQSILVSQRMWFFGLARALGSTRRQIAAMVLLEVGLVLMIGTVLAVAVLITLQPAAADLARNAFGVDAQLLRPSSVPLLVLGSVVVLVVAGAYPASRAVRGDPVDVLEPALT